MITEEPVVEDLQEWSVSEAAAAHADDPGRLFDWMQGAYDRSPQAFREQALAYLQRSEDSPGRECLISFLARRGLLAEALLTADGFTPAQQATIAVQAAKTGPAVLDDFYDHVAESNGDRRRLAMRLLRMLEFLLDHRQAKRIVLRLMIHPDAQVRSKAALLAGKLNHHPQWLAMQLYEQDARLRANGVEAFWGTQSEECLRLLWQAVRGDTNGRVRANALYGIYLSGDPAVIPFILQLFGEGEREQASAIWLIGRTADPRFLPLMERQWKLAATNRRNPILQAMTRIRARIRELEAGPILSIIPSRIRHGDQGWRTMRLSVRGPDRQEVCSLKPLDFVLYENQTEVRHYHIREMSSAPPLAVAFLVDETLGEWALAALEQCVAESLPEDRWAVCTFTKAVDESKDKCDASSGIRLETPSSCVASADPAACSLEQAATALAEALNESDRAARLLFVLTRDSLQLPASLASVPNLSIHLVAPAGFAAPISEPTFTEWFSDAARVPGLVAALYRDWRSNYEVRYQCEPPHWQTDSQIALAVYSSLGVGRAQWTAE